MRLTLLSAILLLSIQMLGVALGQSNLNSDVIAPNGKLRSGSIAIRVLGGVAEPVGKFIATKLGVSYEPVMYPNPDAYVQSFGKGEWDIAIGPRVLAPVEKADSGADVWLIDLLALFAMNFHAARLGFEAQNAMAFRLLRLVSDTNKPASPEILTAEIVEPPAVRAPATKVAPAGTRRASASKVHKKTTRAKKVTKRSK
jgi:polar amino acid transport system substrate-binding protein